VKLYSQAGTGFTYTFTRKRMAPKMELRKYDPFGISLYPSFHKYNSLYIMDEYEILILMILGSEETRFIHRK
jgi:hypothetical protein